MRVSIILKCSTKLQGFQVFMVGKMISRCLDGIVFHFGCIFYFIFKFGLVMQVFSLVNRLCQFRFAFSIFVYLMQLSEDFFLLTVWTAMNVIVIQKICILRLLVFYFFTRFCIPQFFVTISFFWNRHLRVLVRLFTYVVSFLDVDSEFDFHCYFLQIFNFICVA